VEPGKSLDREQILEISLQHTSGASFTAEARHHRVVLDQPAEDGATDQGMSPAELLLASLGGCIGQYVVQYLGARKLSSQGLQVLVRTQPSARPLHFGEFQVRVIVPSLNEHHLRGLVQNALRSENSISVTASAKPEKAKPSSKSPENCPQPLH
jgi:putative redox protein